MGILAAARSFSASPKAVFTWGLSVFSVFGVCTGSFGSNGTFHTDAGAGAGDAGFAVACSQKRRNRSAPRDPSRSCRSHLASTSQALPVGTVPPSEVGAEPLNERHI